MRTAVLLFLFFIVCHNMSAQDEIAISNDSIEINFNIVIPKEKTLSSDLRLELKDKLELALARNGCSGPEGTPFVIVPDVKVINTGITSGTKETFTLIEGECILVAKNKFDGTAFNETNIPLKELVKSGKVGNPIHVLIQSINPKDKRFIRFFRTTQKRISDYYAEKAIIISKKDE